MEEWGLKMYHFVLGLPFVIASWVVKKVIENNAKITALEKMVEKFEEEFERRDVQRKEDREELKEMKQDIKRLLERSASR